MDQDGSNEQSKPEEMKIVKVRQRIHPEEIMERLNLNRIRKMQKMWQKNPSGGLRLE